MIGTMKDNEKRIAIADIIGMLGGSLDCSLISLASWLDEDVTPYTLSQLVPYDVNISRVRVDSPDEISVTLHCRVKGVRFGELVLSAVFCSGKQKPRRCTIYIQYDGHPETLTYDFSSICEAVYVLRLYSQGRIRGARNRMTMTANRF